MGVLKSIEEGNLEIKTRAHGAVILLQSVNKTGILLSHKYDEPKINITSFEGHALI